MIVDLLLAGGGLANALIAFRLHQVRPSIELRLVERGASLGAGHTWSFHDGDVTSAQLDWLEPLIERSWPEHEVRFPGFTRRLSGRYHTITGARLNRVLGQRLGERLLCGRAISDLGPRGAQLDDGSRLEAKAVIDGRGAEPSSALRLGFQKFVGLRVELSQAVNLAGPILMDATVEQRDGFRFVYTLPFSERCLLIEDTRYSEGPELDRPQMRAAILGYAARKGWRVRRVLEEEEGSLPIVLDGDIDEYWRQAAPGVPRSGMRAALFHPTTGYSLPEAVRLADDLANLEAHTSAHLAEWIGQRSIEHWRRCGFFRLLNRMLFEAAEPDSRYRVLERFYRLPEPLIERFYAGRPTLGDRARVLTGRPPVALRRALGCLWPRRTPKPKVVPERI